MSLFVLAATLVLIRTRSTPRNRVASGSADGTIRVWDLRQRQSLHTFNDCHGGSVWAIVAPRTRENPKLLIAGGRDCSIVAYNYESKERYPLVHDKGPVVALAYSSCSGLLWSSNPQPNVNCWVRELDHIHELATMVLTNETL